MVCQAIAFANGMRGIACGPGSRKRCRCGRFADLLCDWKIARDPDRTCDKPICSVCSFSPVEGKDLCREHKQAYDAWRDKRGRP